LGYLHLKVSQEGDNQWLLTASRTGRLRTASEAGKVSIERPSTGGRIVSHVDSKDNPVAFMITPNGDTIPMIPNPAYDPVVVGGRVMFNIGMDEPFYDSAKKAADAKADKEEDINH